MAYRVYRSPDCTCVLSVLKLTGENINFTHTVQPKAGNIVKHLSGSHRHFMMFFYDP